MKTPTSNIAKNGGSRHPAKRESGGHGPNLADEVEWLLPTPKASDGIKGSPEPAPRAQGSEPAVRGGLAAADPESIRHPHARTAAGKRLATAAVGGGPAAVGELAVGADSGRWGQYASAIARWESLTRPAPPAVEEVCAHLDGHRVATGQTKFGAVIGDGVIVPAGTVLQPATLIGAHTTLYPRTQIGGFFPAGSQGR